MDDTSKGKTLKTYSKYHQEMEKSKNHCGNTSTFSDDSSIVMNLGRSLEIENNSSYMQNERKTPNLGISLDNSSRVSNLGVSLQLVTSDVENNHHDEVDVNISSDSRMANISNFEIFQGPLLSDKQVSSTPRKAGKSTFDFSDEDSSEQQIPNKHDNVSVDKSHSFVENIASESSIRITDLSAISTDNDSSCNIEALQVVQSSLSKNTKYIKRPRSKNNYSKLLWKHTAKAAVAKCKYRWCCSLQCLKKFKLKDIETLRFIFWSRESSNRRQWLLEAIICSRLDSVSNRPRFVVNGEKVCPKAFMHLYCINKNLYYKLKQEACMGVTVTEKSRDQNRYTERYLVAMNWLEDYATYHGDRMPDIKRILLPYRTRKNIIYSQYQQEAQSPLHISRFLSMWNEYFSHLRIKKVNSFSKCTVCTSIERQLDKTVDVRKREKLKKLREDHNLLQMCERKYYYRKRDAARLRPDKFLSLIIDGMDQSKSNLPHFVGRMAKAVNPSDQLSTHITGIIAHGQNEFMKYLDLNEYPHDSNLTTNLLLKAIHKIAYDKGRKLPPTCYIQCDNCWRENKNRYTLGFCELLVRLRIFNEVHMSFLMVGHTHEDIDAAFSRIAENLRKNDAETLPQLKSLLGNIKEVDAIYNIRDWLDPYLNDISKHTKPLHYRFQWDFAKNKVHITYKGKQRDVWKPLGGNILKRIPPGKPTLVKPDYARMQIERSAQHLKHWESLFSDQLFKKERKWWDTFVREIREKEKPSYRHTTLEKWLLPELPKQTIIEDDSDVDIPESIARLVANEEQEPEVCLTVKKSKK